MSRATRKFGIAVLGLGRMGSIHVKSLLMNPRAEVKWVMRNDVNKAKQFADSLGGRFQCAPPSQLDKILEDKSVDGVVVASLTSQHEEQIKSSLSQGKAVFSEKPITADIDSTRECYELAEAKSKPLICAFHRRFDPSFLAVKSNLTTQTAGNLRLLRCSSHDQFPPTVDYIKNSGGIFKDSTIHDLDMALWLSGSPAASVHVRGQAFDQNIKDAGDYDLVVVSIEHENGIVSVIDNGRKCAHGYDQRLEAICEEGSFVVTNRSTSQLHLHTTSGSTVPNIDKLFDTRYMDAYINEMEHFLDTMEGADPIVTKTDTLGVMKLAEAAKLSAETGQPVSLNELSTSRSSFGLGQ